MRDLTGSAYVDIRNKTVILVVGQDGDNSTRLRIVTVTPMGDRVRERSIGAHRLTGNYLTLTGKVRKNGYIAVDQFPPGHLLKQIPAVKHATGIADTQFVASTLRTEDINLGDLSDEALALYLRNLQYEVEYVGQQFTDAKDEAKSRGKGDGGLFIVGDTVIEMYKTSRVDDALAKRNLPKDKYDDICVLKADSKRARARLSDADLKLTLQSQGWTLKVREATNEDREKAAKAAVDAFGRPTKALDNVIQFASRNAA